jgi:hypothetical protein
MHLSFKSILHSVVALSLSAQGTVPAPTRAQLIKRVEKAFLSRDLGQVCTPHKTRITVVIEHSLLPPPEGLQRGRFANFNEIEQWLRSLERNEGLPQGEFWPFRFARSGQFVTPNLFEYDNMGLSHNSWNLSRIHFSTHNGVLYISRLVIYDGD